MNANSLVLSRVLGSSSVGGWSYIDFERLIASEGLRGIIADDWATSVSTLSEAAKLGEVLLHVWSHNQRQHILIKREQAYIKIDLEGGTLSCMVAAPEVNKNIVLDIVQRLKEIFPPETKLSGKIWLTFWINDPFHGPQSLRRKITVPSWAEIKSNYPRSTCDGLGSLMNGFRPATGGQLLLWHGVPGTGKTYALRALAREWGPWCRVEYVTDPEDFFGRASYMMSVLMRLGSSSESEAPAIVGSDPKADEREEDKWTLLVLEDTGELLSLDAKQRTGQGLSRFLNLADGIIGQGLKVMTLVTTNEPVHDMHPAVGRPGRCAAEVEFKLFDGAGALEWLESRIATTEKALGYIRDRVRNFKAEVSLAELYASLGDGRGPASGTTRREAGFRGRN